MKRAVVFLNGDLVGKQVFYQNYITEKDTIVCADGGAKHTFQLGIVPDLILGDLDSISNEIITYYQKQDVNFEKFPVEKDKTDFELLLDRLVDEGYNEIIIFAGLGKRFDHSLGNLYLLEKLYQPNIVMKIITARETIEVVTDKKVLKNMTNQTISFLPLSATVTGVCLSGFKYEVKEQTFNRGSTLGMSNIIKSNKATISIESGTMLMIINH